MWPAECVDRQETSTKQQRVERTHRHHRYHQSIGWSNALHRNLKKRSTPMLGRPIRENEILFSYAFRSCTATEMPCPLAASARLMLLLASRLLPLAY
ncbi:Uncharacterized protein APZ42_026428 [Daphnia magna]|uniref:Uncharacterized protein n=1 Tax=Daphnia magna TaxID=35525 RepID=A0A0P6A889_9CRUS|nr:Uncharacterized protein APZ42_026428 [Daphnia magna]